MTLDILYKSRDRESERIHDARLTAVYPHEDLAGAKPELVIHFYEPSKTSKWIPLEDIFCVSITD